MDRPKRLPLLARSALANLGGLLVGIAVGCAVFPETGEFGDAFRPSMIAMAGIIGLMLSGFYTAWFCMRER